MRKELLEKIVEAYILGETGNNSHLVVEKSATWKEFLGKWVILRGYDSGVHFGKLERAEKWDYILSDSRRLWRFWCKKWVWLTDLALYRLSDDKRIKICSTIPKIRITDERVSEIIPVATDMIEHFQLYPVAKQD